MNAVAQATVAERASWAVPTFVAALVPAAARLKVSTVAEVPPEAPASAVALAEPVVVVAAVQERVGVAADAAGK